MAAPMRDTGTHRAMLPYEQENEQRRVYDRRVATWPLRVAAIVLGVIWLSNLGWRLPWNDFVVPGEPVNGVEANRQVSDKQPGPFVDNGRGLYHWLTLMAQFGDKGPVPFGSAVKNVVLPNWRFFGWVSFIVEGSAGVLLILGLLSRVGGFLSLVAGALYFLGLGQVPGQWTWSFVMLAALGFVFMFTGSGRFLGVDHLLRPLMRQQIGLGRTGLRWLYTLT